MLRPDTFDFYRIALPARPLKKMSDISQFLAATTYAVAGASGDRSKFGNRVFRCLLRSGRQTWPLNPNATEVEGHKTFPDIRSLPAVPESLSIITPPDITRQVVAEAVAAGVKNIWMQPGAGDAEASAVARGAGINVIDDGSCILVELGE
jgi:predicted CoA-binding protein